MPETVFLEQHINIVNIVHFKAFGLSVLLLYTMVIKLKTCICLIHHVHFTSTRNNNLLLGNKLLLILK